MFSRSVRHIVLSACTVAVMATALASAARKPEVNIGRGELALQGYDVVAYATMGKATRGNVQFEQRWNNAVWRFATADHRERFASDPEKYAPQFGGYCAYAVSRGYTADIDPEAFRFVAGRLYLNYSKSVQRLWEKNIPENIAKAQANWPGVLEK